MITDPCDCGIKPEGHAHVINAPKGQDIIFWKGVPIIEADDDQATWQLNEG